MNDCIVFRLSALAHFMARNSSYKLHKAIYSIISNCEANIKSEK